MTLKDLLHKHKHLQQSSAFSTSNSTNHPPTNLPARLSSDRSTIRASSDTSSTGPDSRQPSQIVDQNPVPEFTFLRTTTHDQEIIAPPHFPEDDRDAAQAARDAEEKTKAAKGDEKDKKRKSLFRNRSGTIPSRTSPATSPQKNSKSDSRDSISRNSSQENLPSPVRPELKKKLSERLHLSSRSRSSSRATEASPYIPEDLGDAPEPAPAPLEAPDAKGKVKEYESRKARAAREALWEQRGWKLALNLHVPTAGPWGMAAGVAAANPRRTRSGGFVDEKDENNIQQAIRLHESGNLERSTAIFGRLADPRGANNPLSQVLYGLALRHGWGIEPSSETAILYLSLAARTSAQIQQISPTGEAKGELILSMFELGNCYRFGWGCKVDKAAARVFYEVAANLGDPDALEEIAWCLMEGFGGGKDKLRAAQYYRLAECAGRRRVGESWIWKDKYNIPPHS